MRKWRKILALALAAVLSTGSLTGCLIHKPSRDNDSSPAVPAPDDIWAPYDETVVITTIVEENSGTNFQGDDDYQNNPWYQAYKDRFNIELRNKWVSNDYNTKINLAIADRDLPDVFYVDYSRMVTLQKAGLIMNLDDLFERYASDTLKQYWADNKDTWDTGCFDGSLYGIPQMGYGTIDQFQYIWIRQDWMQECGFDAPKTMDDVIEIATTFAKKYGGYALPEDQNLQNFKRLAMAWGAHPDIWVEQADGTLGYGNVQPEMKEALAQYAQWYKDGTLNPNFTTMNHDKMVQDIINGACGVVPFAQWFSYNPLPDLLSNHGPDAIFYPYEIPTIDGSPIMQNQTFSNGGYVVINSNCQNPEAAMKIINFFCYMMDDAVEGGESNEFIASLFDNNYTNIVRGTRVINPMTDFNQYVQIHDAVGRWLAGEQVDTSELGKNVSKFNSCVNWNESQDVNGVGDWLQQGNERSTYGIAKQYLDDGQYLKDAMWGAQTETLRSAGSTLGDILTEGFTKIIIGEQPIDYFDTVVSQWWDAGGDKATAEINETYGH